MWKGVEYISSLTDESRVHRHDRCGRGKLSGVAKRRYIPSLSELTCGFFRTASCGLPGGDSTSLSKTPVIFRLRATVGCVADIFLVRLRGRSNGQICPRIFLVKSM